MESNQMMPGSKWTKHVAVYQSEFLRRYLPDTSLYSEEQLQHYVMRYGVAFVKPTVGGGGHNIFRIQRVTDGRFVVNMRKERRVYTRLSEVHQWIESIAPGKRFLIQNAIDLANWQNRPVDVRVVTQINEKGDWEVTGVLAKLAGANMAVTNVAAGGSVHRMKDYLRGLGYDEETVRAKRNELQEVAVAIARHLRTIYANAIYGFDIGMDTAGHFWLIEANTVPDLTAFKLYRKREHQRMMALWRVNGAINSKALRMLRDRQKRQMAQRRGKQT